MHIAQLISDFIYCLQGSRLQDTQWTRRSPTGSWSCQALSTGLCQFYGVSVAPSKVISPPHQSSFHQEVLRPQAGVGRNTTAALGWPVAGNRHTAPTSRVHLSSSAKRLERCLRHMADQQATKSKANGKQSTRSVTYKPSCVQLKTLKKRY